MSQRKNSLHEKNVWKDARKGFRHELRLILVEVGFSYRTAEAIIKTVFETIKTGLLSKEDVAIEDFGTWSIETTPPDKGRAWRFGKVTAIRPHRVVFTMDDEALSRWSDKTWNPHRAWQITRTRKPRLKGRKLAEFEAREKRERDKRLLKEYTRTIIRFFLDELYAENLNLFWMLRWNSDWYRNEIHRVPPDPSELCSIERAVEVINETRPQQFSSIWVNRAIDSVCWYARWTSRLTVDKEIWREAERSAYELMRSGQYQILHST